MASYIRGHHDGHTGIIYCLSKKDCDQLAETLRRERIEAAAYHADLTDAQRGEVGPPSGRTAVLSGRTDMGRMEATTLIYCKICGTIYILAAQSSC